MLIFCHANGFPPESYQQLFKILNKKIYAPKLAPLKRDFGPKDAKKNWDDFGDELIADLQQSDMDARPIAIGHSMGAVLLLRAACQKPHWFKRLILIDPTLLPESFVYASNYLPRFINRKIHPVASKAYRRRDRWPSRQAAFDALRQKKLFRSFSGESLWDYVNSAIADSDQHDVALKYSKQWEEHCFLSVINAWPLLKACQTPIIGITGQFSELMRPKIIER